MKSIKTRAVFVNRARDYTIIYKKSLKMEIFDSVTNLITLFQLIKLFRNYFLSLFQVPQNTPLDTYTTLQYLNANTHSD